MSVTIVRHKGYRWVAFDGVDEESIDYLRKNFKFHALDLEDVKGESEHPKLDVYKYYLLLITHFPTADSATKRVHFNELDIFIEHNTFVTIPNRESPYIKNIVRKLQKNVKLREEWFAHGPSFLCYKLLKGLYYDSFKPIRNTIASDLRDLEEQSLGRDTKEVLLGLTKVRRDVLDLKRILNPQRFIIQELTKLKASFLPQDMTLYFDDLRDLLDRNWSFVEHYESIIKSLSETNESLISLRTSDIVKVLTVISVSFLPLTLLTGIYGMNLIHLPFADHPTTVWFMFAFIVGFLGLIFGVLRKIKWL